MLSFFGDSLLDTGNLTAILVPSGITPFPSPLYNAGKASNGQVLGEATIAALDISPDTLIPRFTVPMANPLAGNINYAIAGATTGFLGSAGVNLETAPIGLQSQVALFMQDLSAATGLAGQPAPDAIVAAGSNDILEILTLENLPRLLGVLSTPSPQDNQQLIKELADTIFANLREAITILDNAFDDVVVFGLPPVGDTPFAIQMDQSVDALLPGNNATRTRDFLTGVAQVVNDRLSDAFDGQGQGQDKTDVEDVLVVDAFQVFKNGLKAWEKDLRPTEPITDISYRDYLTTMTGLPPNLPISQFAFIDGSHPTDTLNQSLAAEIVPIITATFSDFGTMPV